MMHYIVWNESKTEGYITSRFADAVFTVQYDADIGLEAGEIGPSLGIEFAELYDGDNLTIQEIELDTQE